MDKNVEFLNYIYQNAEMGKNSINQLLGIINEGSVNDALESQLKEYEEIYSLSENSLKERDKEGKGIGLMTKISTYIMININTMKDSSPSHIAEMMIQGSTMGIVEITRKLKQYEEAEGEIYDLGERLLKFEEENIEKMKKLL